MTRPVDDLISEALDSVHRDPARAIRLADEVLGAPREPPPSDEQTALALWARGQAHRERNRLHPALDDLRTALVRARGDRRLEGEIYVSLAAVEFYLGDAPAAERSLAEAESRLDGTSGRLLMQQGLVAHRQGRLGTAADAYRRAIPLLDHGGDAVGAARAHSNLGVLLMQRGEDAAAAQHLQFAIELARANAQGVTATVATHNLGCVHSAAGRIADALRCFAEAEADYLALGELAHLPALHSDRAAALSEVRLLDEAMADADAAMALAAGGGNVVDLGDVALSAAIARREAGELVRAVEAVDLAIESFGDQGREAWAVRGRWVRWQMQPEGGAEAAAALADALESAGWSRDAVFARAAAVRIAAAEGRIEEAERLLGRTGDEAGLLERIAVATADAAVALAVGDRSRLAAAAGRGLDDVDRTVGVIASAELRMFAARRGEELIGWSIADAADDPARLLRAIERARRLDHDLAPHPGRAADRGLLARWRRTEQRVADASNAAERADAVRRQVELERTIRTRAFGRAGSSSLRTDEPFTTTALGERALVQFATLDDRLVAVVARADGPPTRVDLAPIPAVREAIAAVTVPVQRLQRDGLSAASAAAARSLLDRAAGRMGDVFEPLVAATEGRPVVVVPSAVVRSTLWRLVPGFEQRSISIAPSYATWSRCRTTAGGAAVCVAGPALPYAGDEVRAVGAQYRSAEVLAGDAASSAALLAAFSRRVDVAHLACHGRFRADSPMFSSLLLGDGPVTVYDLDQGSMPSVIVLSSCDVARSAVVRGDAVLGLATALLQLGASTVIAPLTPVNDAGSVELMASLHTRLAAGVPPAAALAGTGVTDDGELEPIAAPFVCFGA